MREGGSSCEVPPRVSEISLSPEEARRMMSYIENDSMKR
jgi:hypothetical protein